MTADAVGGVWTYALDLARQFGHRDMAVTLAVMGPEPSASQYAESHQLPGVTVRHAPFRLEWMEEPWHDVKRAGAWLLELEREHRPDVVHLNGYGHAALPWRAPVLLTAHSCVLSWWAAVHGTDAPAEWDRYAANVCAGLAAADVVVAPTAAMLRALTFHYGPPRRSMVIPNGRDRGSGIGDPRVPGLSNPESRIPNPESRIPNPGTPESRMPNPESRIPNPGKEPLIFSSGRVWDPAKNMRLLSDCADQLPWPIYVAGDTTSPHGDCISLPDVTCLGRLDSHSMEMWMQRACIYALPARYEPFGLSVLEAALAGCALVLGDIPSLREVWGPAIVYVPVDDRGALIDALQRLIEDQATREQLADRARQRAFELSAHRMAQAYCDAYQQLVDERRGAPDRVSRTLESRIPNPQPRTFESRIPNPESRSSLTT